MNHAEDKASKKPVPEKEPTVNSLEHSIANLQKLGGFDLLENVIGTFSGSDNIQYPGVENLAPSRPARKNIFLSDNHWKAARKALKKRLQIWKTQLTSEDDFEQLLIKSGEKVEKATTLFHKNLKTASEAIKDLETGYRTLASFYTNAEKAKGAKIENVDLMNASMEQLKDKDNPIFLNRINEQLESAYNRLDLMNNYSLLVVPGWLGSNDQVSRFAETASRLKVLLVTDFMDVESPEDAMEMSDSYQLQSADPHKAYTCMTCNYIVGRAGVEGIDETLFLPPSCAVAGQMYRNPTQLPSAGVTHGRLKEITGVRFPIKHTELGEFNERGIIPITYEFGKAMSFGVSTLFNGDEPGYKTYSVLRTHNFILKTIKDLLNRYTFRLIDTDLERDIRSKISKFFEKNKGSGRLIEKFEIKSLDVIDNDQLRLNIDVKYWFPARVMEINLEGLEGEVNKDWKE